MPVPMSAAERPLRDTSGERGRGRRAVLAAHRPRVPLPWYVDGGCYPGLSDGQECAHRPGVAPARRPGYDRTATSILSVSRSADVASVSAGAEQGLGSDSLLR